MPLRITSSLLQTCRCFWNTSKRNYALSAALPEYRKATQAKQSCNRSYLSASLARKSIPDLSLGTQTQLLGLNIDNVAKEDLELILKPILYATSVPKKDSKSFLIQGFNYWMNLPSDLCEIIQQIFSILYESELIIGFYGGLVYYRSDDIYDESNYRRGLPTAHQLYGVPQTHIGAKFCLFIALKKLIELNNIEAIEVFADELMKNYSGQYREIEMRDNKICPTIEQYEQICVNKTEPVISIIVKFMQAFSHCKTDFSHLSRSLGIYYQYMNDLSILCEPKCWDAKGFCEDISEGKYTLAVIHAIDSGTQEGDIVSAIVQQKPKDIPTLKYCLSLLEKLGSIDFARNTLTKAEKDLRQEIERLGGNPPLLEYINAITSMKYDEESENRFVQDSWSQQ